MERVEPSKFDGEPYDYGGFRWGEESSLGRWIREHPEEVWEMERTAAREESRIAEQKRHTRNRILRFLVAHPTPWHIAEGYRLDGAWRDGVGRDDMVETSQVWEVRDANTGRVLPPCEPSLQIEDLVDFVNLVGEQYEPPCGWHTAYDPTEVEDWPHL